MSNEFVSGLPKNFGIATVTGDSQSDYVGNSIQVTSNDAPVLPITFRSSSTTNYASRDTLTITAPSGITNGDVMVAHVLWSGNAVTVTAPSGWAQLGSTLTASDGGGFYLNSGIFTKTAASESGSYVWTSSWNAGVMQGMIDVYSGANGTVNAYSSNWAINTGNTNADATGITTTVNGCMLIYTNFDWGDTFNNLTPPTGFTERDEVNPLVYGADMLQSTAGATGTVTHATNSNSSNPRGAWLIALAPAAGGSGVTVNVTGQAGATANGNESVIGKASVSPTGQALTASRGSVTVAAGGNVTVNLTGSAGASALGNESVIGKARVSPTGQAGVTALGNESVIGKARVTLTGRLATLSSGTVSFPNVTVPVTGRAGTTASGTVNAGPITIATIYLEGWSYLGWGDQGWGQATFEQGGMTGSVGNVEVTGKPTIYVTGVSATCHSGNPLITSAPDVYVDGVPLLAEITDPSLSLDCTTFVTGNSATVFQNASGILVETPVVVDGVELASAINDVWVIGHALVEVTGIHADIEYGDAYVSAWDRIPDRNNNWTPVDRPDNGWTPVSTSSTNWTPVHKG